MTDRNVIRQCLFICIILANQQNTQMCRQSSMECFSGRLQTVFRVDSHIIIVFTVIRRENGGATIAH